MALQRAVYRPRDAAHTVLHQVIAEHLEAFLRAVAEAGDGAGLPQFVERKFREFLTSGARIIRSSCACRSGSISIGLTLGGGSPHCQLCNLKFVQIQRSLSNGAVLARHTDRRPIKA